MKREGRRAYQKEYNLIFHNFHRSSAGKDIPKYIVQDRRLCTNHRSNPAAIIFSRQRDLIEGLCTVSDFGQEKNSGCGISSEVCAQSLILDKENIHAAGFDRWFVASLRCWRSSLIDRGISPQRHWFHSLTNLFWSEIYHFLVRKWSVRDSNSRRFWGEIPRLVNCSYLKLEYHVSPS